MFNPDAMQMQDLTTDDVSRINKAMKSEQFGNLMQDYLDEISDPNHRGEYDQYMEQLEAKGELPDGMELLRCEPGFCVRTEVCFKNGQTQKCYINVCFSPLLKDVEMVAAPGGQQVSLPYSLSPPRVDRDSKKDTCLTCDFGISENSFAQCKQNPDFLRMIVDIATKNLSQNFLKGFEEVKNDFKILKKISCKGGKPYMMSVRTADLRKEKRKKGAKKAPNAAAADGVTPGELKEMKKDATKRMKNMLDDDEDEDDEEDAAAPEDEPTKKIRVPQHHLVHQGEIDFLEFDTLQPGLTQQADNLLPRIPRKLKLVVKLPGVQSAGEIELDVQADNVVVESAYFYLDLPLPYTIVPDDGTAKFDKPRKDHKELTLVLPVAVSEENLTRAGTIPAQDADGELAKRSNYEKFGIGAADGDDDIVKSDDEDSEGGLPELPPDEVVEKTTDETTEEPPPGPGETQTASTSGGAAEKEKAEKGPTSSDGASSSSRGEVRRAADDSDEITYLSPRNKSLTPGDDFVAEKYYSGSRPGYFFGTGSRGTGYYRDPTAPAAAGRKPSSEVLLRAPSGAGAASSSASKSASSDPPLVEEISTTDAETSSSVAEGRPGADPSSCAPSTGLVAQQGDDEQESLDLALQQIPPEYIFHEVVTKSSSSSSTSTGSGAEGAEGTKEAMEMSDDEFYHFESPSHLVLFFPPPVDPDASVEISNAEATKSSANRLHFQLEIGSGGRNAGGTSTSSSSSASSSSSKITFHRVLSRHPLRVPQQWSWYRTEEALVVMLEKEDEDQVEGDLEFLPEEEQQKSWVLKNQAASPGEGDESSVGGGAGGNQEEDGSPTKTGQEQPLEPLLTIRSEDGDTSMGHAVLLRTRLFLELM